MVNRKWLGIPVAAWMMGVSVGAHADSGDLGGVIRVSREAQSASGISVAVLHAASRRPTVQGYGFIESLAPLIRLSEQSVRWRAQLAADRAQEIAADREYRRLSLLFQDQQNVARKRVEEAAARKSAAQAAVARARQEVRSVATLARLQWGPVLGAGVATGGAPLSGLLAGKAALLEVQVPRSVHLPAAPPSIEVLAPSGGRPATASLLSAAPAVAPGIQGRAYFYQVAAPWVQTGLGVTALVPLAGAAASGVVVPARAVVWYGNRSWVYVKSGDTGFRRTLARLGPRVPGGWFVGSGLSPSDQVVVAGAELLLSQELLSQSAGGGGDD